MGRQRAQDELEALVAHEDPPVRRAIAGAIAACSALELVPLLRRLAVDEDASVREEAIAAVRSTKSAEFLDVLLDAIAERRLRANARASLLAIGQPALDALTGSLCDESLPLRVRLHVPRSLSYFDPDSAAAVLLGQLAQESRADVQYKIIRALCHLHFRRGPLQLDEPTLHAIVDATLDDSRATYVWLVALRNGSDEDRGRRTPCAALLSEVLAETLLHSVERVLRLLSLTHGEEDYRRIYRGLSSDNPTMRAGALELLRSSLDSEYQDRALGLISDEPEAHRLARLQVAELPSYETALEQMISGPNETIAALAAYHASELGLERPPPSADRSPSSQRRDREGGVERARDRLVVARNRPHG
jgi:hypothetical protein